MRQPEEDKPEEAWGDWRDTFIATLREQGVVTTAVKAVHVHRCTVYRYRDIDERFRKAWDDAVELVLDGIQDSMMMRAKSGSLEPVIYKGEHMNDSDGKPMFIRKWDTLLQIFVMRNRRPEVWNAADSKIVDQMGDRGVMVAPSGKTPHEWIKNAKLTSVRDTEEVKKIGDGQNGNGRNGNGRSNGH